MTSIQLLALLATSLSCSAVAELFYPEQLAEAGAAAADFPFGLFPEDLAFQPAEEAPQDAEGLFIPTKIGQASGVAVNSLNQLIIFHRAGRVWDQYSFDAQNVFNRSLGPLRNATLTLLDPSNGQVLGEHGAGLFLMPHGLSVDAEDNVWVTDVGRHQVIKLDKHFKPLLELGEKGVPGSDSAHFCKPTDVAVARTGEFFVADGYCNSRIMKFDREGRFVGEFGAPNSGIAAKNGQFFVPHSLALIEDMNLLCVADRDNQRVQCFTAGLTPKGAHRRAVVPTGTFVTKAENIGRIMALREKNHFLVGVTNTEPAMADDYSLFIMDINSGRANTFANGISDAHSLAISELGEIYVAQLGPQEVTKFSLPAAAAAAAAEEEELEPPAEPQVPRLELADSAEPQMPPAMH